jgi:20S proteasome subunit alpha 4
VIGAFSGLNSDGRILIDKARVEAQSYKLNYDMDPSIEYMSRYVSGYVQKYTQ